ncbi:hypothetical protein ACJU26_08960 [Acidithiobacillus sp. M4-SHS-6]|uniref:hypothetical protein n=1 Tax=Acidithiobacillus sp. M4-SHS-6 TaxID=3383024 RepID=UPI0039BEA2B3
MSQNKRTLSVRVMLVGLENGWAEILASQPVMGPIEVHYMTNLANLCQRRWWLSYLMEYTGLGVHVAYRELLRHRGQGPEILANLTRKHGRIVPPLSLFQSGDTDYIDLRLRVFVRVSLPKLSESMNSILYPERFGTDEDSVALAILKESSENTARYLAATEYFLERETQHFGYLSRGMQKRFRTLLATLSH